MPLPFLLPLASLADLDLWVGVAIFLSLCSLAYLVHALLTQARRMERSLEKLDGLAKLHALLSKMVESQQALELRRLEHVLLDIRDGQRRFEERLVALVESINSSREAMAVRGNERSNSPAAAGAALHERIIGRLLALGFERVALITPVDALDALALADGEVVVEARRNGALHKGRVLLRGGSITDVQMRAVYEIFP